MQSSPLPQTPGTSSSRYPASLSHATSSAHTTVPGPSRPPTRGYPAPSIDSSIASPPSTSSVPLHEYSSLADLLHQAGYKETRVYTPEAEKIRSRIKKTLDDENEDEINALYGTYGFDRTNGLVVNGDGHGLGHGEIRHHITEPGLPMKSSSSILRSLALQDAASSLPKTETPDQSWWSAWGRIPKSEHTSPDAKSNASYEASTEVGLGLAKGGEGVRKVRSAWDLERSRPRRAGTDSPPQEERPPRPRVPSSPADVISTTSATGYTYTPTRQPTRRIEKDIFSSPPPPPAVEEDAYGYCPLPEDYEAQCTEDEAMYAMGVNDYTDIYSLGSNSNSASAAASLRDTASIISSSGSERSRTRSETEERAVREIQEFQDEMAMIDEVDQVGQRILRDAVQYDDSLEFDSPDSQTTPLPDIGAADSFRMPTIPVPSAPQHSAQTRYLEREETPDTPKPAQQAEQQKKPLKYGDRATRLRIAHSTPALRQTAIASAPPLPEGWLGSIKSALIGKTVPAIASTSSQPPPFTSQPKGPIRISPITPAMPTLVTTSPVICDSISTEAEDLPPVPSPRIVVTSSGSSSASSGISSFALKLRPSLAKLRDVVLGSTVPVATLNEDNTSPMLSPRLDWGEQGEQFAGWSPAKSKKSKEVLRDSNEGGIDALFGPQAVAAAAAVYDKDIDYSKSFFYKPTTPPKPAKSNGSNGDGTQNPTCTVTPSTPPNESERPGMKKRQSIKSLKAALLLPVAPSPAAQPPVPAIPAHLSHLATPRKMKDPLRPPILAIQSPGAWQPRELVLEGEEWDAREGSVGDWGRGRGKGRATKGSGMRRRKSKKVVRD